MNIEVVKTKKAQSLEIFSQELDRRAKGEFPSNKAFRAHVLQRMVTEIGVSKPSACSMYNVCKDEALRQDPTLVFGRDPKVEKPAKAPKAPKTVTKEVSAEEILKAVDSTETV